MDLTDISPSSALLTVIALGLAPFVAVMITSFTKIVVVLSLLRNALGLQNVPPNLALNGLAVVLSLYVMFPVGVEMKAAIGDQEILGRDSSTMIAAAEKAREPLRAFLKKHAEPRERKFFLKTIRKMVAEKERMSLSADDFIVLIPAFTISELTVAFQIGFLVFLPFLIIDLVVANILMAMGMMMLSPTIISLPFKLLLFVLIDGWIKLAHGLVLSYL